MLLLWLHWLSIAVWLLPWGLVLAVPERLSALLRMVMALGLLGVFVSGAVLSYRYWPMRLGDTGWFWTKLAVVVAMAGLHGMTVAALKRGQPAKAQRWTGIAGALSLAVLALALWKPF